MADNKTAPFSTLGRWLHV